MDKRVLRERMRKKQQQLRRRRMMRLAGYVIGLVLVIVFVVRGIILPIAHKIGGETDKPTEIQAEATSTEVVEPDPDAAVRKPLKGSGLVTKASELPDGMRTSRANGIRIRTVHIMQAVSRKSTAPPTHSTITDIYRPAG